MEFFAIRCLKRPTIRPILVSDSQSCGEMEQKMGSSPFGLSDIPKHRANMRVRVGYLAKFPRVEWDKKHFHKIKNGDGLSELKWRAEGREFRAAGYDYKGYFVMVLGFTHKGTVYDPPRWLESAKKNRKDATDGRWELVEFEA
jgi:hypothetical protein